MPRDLLAEEKTAKKKVTDFLSNLPARNRQEIDQSLATSSRIRGDLVGAQPLTDLVGSVSSQYGLPNTGIDPTQVGQINKRLTSESDSNAAIRARKQARDKINMIYNTLVDNLTRSGASYQDAVAYARDYALKEADRVNRAAQNQMERESALRKDKIAQEYSDKGLALQQELEPQSNITNSMIRALMGLGGTLGSGYLLTRNKTNPQILPGNFMNVGGMGQSNQFAFQTPQETYFNSNGSYLDTYKQNLLKEQQNALKEQQNALKQQQMKTLFKGYGTRGYYGG